MAVWNLENAAHLLRRAAFGGTRKEIEAFLGRHGSVSSAVGELMSFPVSSRKPPKGNASNLERTHLAQRQWWLKTMLRATAPRDALREKMVLFWHGHLCSGYSKQPEPSLMAIQNGMFRRFAKGNFRELVRNFNRDPANLYYLDGITNYASEDTEHVAANENFGREIMELFTLGITQLASDGTDDVDPLKRNYTESDVHQLARALTGWVEIEKDVGVWRDWAWDGGQYDDGGGSHHPGDPVTIFGVTNNGFRIDAEIAGTDQDVLELILGRLDDDDNHQAAMFLCRKLWTYFAYPPPEAGLKALFAEFAQILVASDYEIAPVLTAMFNHDKFYSDAAKSRTVKNPVDFMVGTFRTLGVKSAGRRFPDADELVDMLANMGMALFEPPNVAGWPGGDRWITTGTLVNRMDFARRLAELDYGSSLRLETMVPLGNAETDPVAVADAIIEHVGLDGTLGGVPLTSEQRDALIDYLTDGGTKASLDLTHASTDDAREFVRGALAIVLQSAEAQIF